MKAVDSDCRGKTKQGQAVRIHQTVWGNWYGYLGNRKVIEFGMDEKESREWLEQMKSLDNPLNA